MPDDGCFVALFTGSRTWRDEDAIRKAIIALPTESVVIVGDASSGADEIVRRLLCDEEGNPTPLANEQGVSVEVHHADWDVHGRVAGLYRNLAMLDRRPDVVYAFLKNNSRGTRHVIREARRRGIKVVVHRMEC